MTVRQLHYTSCEDGTEGIQGFQVAAISDGAPKPLVDLAIRTSAYEAGPELVARMERDTPDTFPVAFGYAPSGRSAVLFQSRYLGTDFTGRTGNYFAHALLFDDVERELGATLPIELWRSPLWVHRRSDGPGLPAVTTLSPGCAADLAATRRFLTTGGHLARLGHLLAELQAVLAGGRGRLVLVVPGAEDAMRWLAAVCRSLPPQIAKLVSFITYTSRPEEAGVLLACTTPDVRLPAYGDFTAVDLTGGARPGPGTRYSSVLTQLWEAGAADEALAFAAHADPAVPAGELEQLATLLEFQFDLQVTTPVDDTLLAALHLAVARLPHRLSPQAWQRVADHVQDHGGPHRLDGWSDVLRAAAQQGEPVPATLYGTYFIAALGSTQQVWLPKLDAADLEDVAEHTVVPALSGRTVAQRLGEHRELRDAVVRVLERRLADPSELRRLATSLSEPSAQALASGARGRLLLLTDLVLARGRTKDPVQVLSKAARLPEAEWQHLGSVLWPGDLPADDCLRLLTAVPAPVLIGAGLARRVTETAIALSAGSHVGPDTHKLIDALLRSPLANDLQPRDHDALHAVRRIAHFSAATPDLASSEAVSAGLATARQLPGELREQLTASIASFVLRGDPLLHQELLELALSEHAALFLPAYQAAVRADLATAPPPRVAGVIVGWRLIDNAVVRRQLENDVLPAALRRRRGRQLDKIGTALRRTGDHLGVPAPRVGWEKWWQSWRLTHERRGLLRLLGLRRR
ncbi:GTPase-associated protein 1-related protein [Nocardia sp. NRRL S-836]|uniref:GTPase-associated protein 1-related protein n=1 Tax=Nocardia sp. NRRL S-836 TaxID=1519492 RepID=UPI0006AE7AFA|nr:GTPase-associated protein 1-related protein [Nocardia sp. NRRL S-836]KOV90040.1 hypothetical protein ADL03_01345 [Nocardia sp. NRRL S-836]